MTNLSKVGRVLIPAFFLILLFISCKDNINNPTTDKTISGILVDEQGRGIPFAVLQVDNSATSIKSVITSDTTDEDGKFSISKLPEDLNVLKVIINHPDFKTLTYNLSDFKTKSSTPVPLRHYDSCNAFFQMTIKGLPDSTLLDSVEVRMFRNNLIRKAYTSQGIVVFDDICPGIYSVRIFKSGYKLNYLTFTFHGGDTIRGDFYLQAAQMDSCCHGQICVTPLDSATQQPLVGTNVSFYIGSILQNTYKYQYTPVCFTGLCPGNYYIHLDMDGYNGAGIGETLTCNDTISIHKALLKATTQDTCCKGVYKVFLIDKSTGAAPTHLIQASLSQNGTALQTISITGGYVYFSKICPGTYQLKLLSQYYSEIDWNYTAGCNNFDTTTKYLDPLSNADSCCHGKINVTVKDSSTGNNIDPIAIYLSMNGTNIKNGITSGGIISFTGLCPGTYSIYEGSKTGWTRCNPFSWNVTLGCNDSASVTGLLKQVQPDTCCNGKIVIHINNKSTGTPVDSVSVSISQNNSNTKSYMTVNGTVTFTGLCPGTYSLYYYKPGWWRPETFSWNVTMGCNDYQEYTKTIQPFSECCNGTISGTVLDSIANAPIANAKIYLHVNNGTSATATSDANGAFQFTSICPGYYNMSISAYGYNYKDTPYFNQGCNDTSNNLTIQMVKK